MDPHPHPRLVAVDIDRFHRSLGLQHRTDRDEWVSEHRHDPVTHPLDDVAAGVQQWRFDRPRHSPQELERGVVAGVQRPGGEAHEVGENDGDLLVCRTPGHRLGQGLPDLQRTETDLPRRATAFTQQAAGGPGCSARATLAGRRQWVAEIGVARQKPARTPDQSDHTRALIGAAQPLRRTTY